MSLLNIIKRRYSVRNYLPDTIEFEKINAVLEAGRLAPSAVNFQPWHFVVIQSPEALSAIHECYHREWFNTAPACIVICGDHNQGWKRAADKKDHTDIDIAITTDHMTLMATALGLGTCWVCNFDVEKTKQTLKLPDHLEPIVLLPIGYPASSEIPDKKRKPLQEIVSYDTYK